MLELKTIKTVGVGSKNPIKISAVEAVFAKLGLDVAVTGIAVASGVSDMPLSIDETMQGSLNRAKAIIAGGGYDMGIGLEGGIDCDTMLPGSDQCWLFGWTSVIDRDGYVGQGSSGMFQLPSSIASALKEGKELGPYMAEQTGIDNIKHKGGTIGFLTNGLISREASFMHATITALIPWMHAGLYK